MKSTELHKKITAIENDLDARRHRLSPKTIEQIEDRLRNLNLKFISLVEQETHETRQKEIAKTLADFDKNN